MCGGGLEGGRRGGEESEVGAFCCEGRAGREGVSERSREMMSKMMSKTRKLVRDDSREQTRGHRRQPSLEEKYQRRAEAERKETDH